MSLKWPDTTAYRGRKAFTLLELLAVVTVLTLLLGQAIPAAKKAREASKQLTCQEKLSGIATAALVYASNDPGELAIPLGVGDGHPLRREAYTANYGFGGKSGVGASGSANHSIWSGKHAMGAMHRPLNTILFKTPFEAPPSGGGRGSGLNWSADNSLDLDIYHCPADEGFPGMHHRGWREEGSSSYDHYGTSYAATPLFVRMLPGQNLHSNSVYKRPVSKVSNPAKTVLYWENAARYAPFAANKELDQTGCSWPYDIGGMTARGWHGTPFHFYLSFVDGHVAWTEVRGSAHVALPPAMPPNCDGEACACLFVRGPGWQLDTLPADFVATHKRLGEIGAGGAEIWEVAARKSLHTQPDASGEPGSDADQHGKNVPQFVSPPYRYWAMQDSATGPWRAFDVVP